MNESDSESTSKKKYTITKTIIMICILLVGILSWNSVYNGNWREAVAFIKSEVVNPPATVNVEVNGDTNTTTLLPGAYNGFDVSAITIPLEYVMGGGPPKDGIPSITNPKFTSIAENSLLRDDDIVISYTSGDTTRAYPLKILVWHEIVNDKIDGKPLFVTYCPLCGTSMVFDGTYNGSTLTFGVSGLLYNSDVLMYDYQNESLWSQIKMEAVSGPLVGQKLTWLPSTEMTWAAWKAQYPNGEVLSENTGYVRNYKRMGYQSYFKSPSTMFKVPVLREELNLKEWVIGIQVGETYKAYPLESLKEKGEGGIQDVVANTTLSIVYNSESQEVTAINVEQSTKIPHVKLYWFAWQAFYPETEFYTE